MATAFICLSASLTTGARAAFVRNSAFTSRSAAAFGTRSSFVPNRAALLSSKTTTWLKSPPSALAASTATDSKVVEEYDVINKEKGLESYNPSAFESEIYAWWENSGCFQPDAKQSPNPTDEDHQKKKPYVLPMPPPNVTGRLHMGHAIFVALQDILARFHRMRGRPVLWLPGM